MKEKECCQLQWNGKVQGKCNNEEGKDVCNTTIRAGFASRPYLSSLSQQMIKQVVEKKLFKQQLVREKVELVGPRCVLMIKAAVELRKVVRSNSCCLTYGDIQILDCMKVLALVYVQKDKILAELNKLMHNLYFIFSLVGLNRLQWVPIDPVN